MLFLYGTGRNGKSVFLNTLMGIWGDYAKRAPSSLFINSVNEGHPTGLAGLKGARLVVGSELPAGKSWNEAVIKDLTGGDRLTARLMRQDFSDFDPQFTLVIAGNHQPAIHGVDEAMRSRICLVPFSVTIPPEERDPDLEEKLRSEWPAILRWCVVGALEWQQEGLNPPLSVVAASDQYLEEEDLIGQFLGDRIEEDTDSSVARSALYHEFREWMESMGYKPWSHAAVAKAIRERGLFKDIKVNGTRKFKGMRIKVRGAKLNDSR